MTPDLMKEFEFELQKVSKKVMSDLEFAEHFASWAWDRAVEEAAFLAEAETLEGEWDSDWDPKIHRFAKDVASRLLTLKGKLK